MDEVTNSAVISVAEAAKILGVSRYTFYRWAQQGKVPTVRIGRNLLVPTKFLDLFKARMDEQAESHFRYFWAKNRNKPASTTPG